MKVFKVGLHHDSGLTHVYVWANDEDVARLQVMLSERCPERSVVSCVEETGVCVHGLSDFLCMGDGHYGTRAQEMEYWR